MPATKNNIKYRPTIVDFGCGTHLLQNPLEKVPPTFLERHPRGGSSAPPKPGGLGCGSPPSESPPSNPRGLGGGSPPGNEKQYKTQAKCQLQKTIFSTKDQEWSDTVANATLDTPLQHFRRLSTVPKLRRRSNQTGKDNQNGPVPAKTQTYASSTSLAAVSCAINSFCLA